MKTTLGVFFGGRSVESEISVISALQAIAALDTERYRVVPVYITKQGRWLTGPELLDTAAYRDLDALERRATEVWMRPVLGDRRLYRRGFPGRDRVVAELDIALPVLHGTNGEDGTFQGLLELIGIPYVGCGVLSSAVGMDKIAMKMMLASSGLPVVEYVWFTDRSWGRSRDEQISRVEAELGYPVVVKPANLGSSVGISRAADRTELISAVDQAAQYSSRLLVERMIEPLREINCSVFGSADDCRASVCEEPVRSSEILSYADKYMSGRNADGGKGYAKSDGGKLSAPKLSAGLKIAAPAPKLSGPSGSKASAPSGGMSSLKRRIPADLPPALTEQIRSLAAETFRVLDCDGVARIDFLLDDSAGNPSGPRVFVNEINTIPGSLSFYLWEAAGMNFAALLDGLISGALRRDRVRSRKTVVYPDNIFSFAPRGKGGTEISK